MDLHELTAAEALARIRAGDISAGDYARGLIARCEAVERRLRALAHFDADRLLADAAAADLEIRKARAAETPLPSLAGIPVGVKDIFDTAGVPTRAGSALYAEHIPAEDAAPVRLLRQAGAVLHSKTVTAALAYTDPGPTRNPWDLSHTPGGSSQGSAAGVAAGLFPIALGTQTAGSTVRPASYCGVTALVPTRGRVPLDGVLPFAPSLDQIGIFARSVEDLGLAFSALAGTSAEVEPLDRAPFLGIAREYFVATAEDEMGRTAIHVARTIAASGANVHVVHLPQGFAEVHRHHQRIMEVEIARFHGPRFADRRKDFGPKVAELIAAGLEVSDEDYKESLAHRDRFRAECGRLLVEIDALVLPAVPSAAPYGLESTGDARFSVPWTNAGLPVVVLPAARSVLGLPLGIQLVGAPGTDLHLLRVARSIEESLAWPWRVAPFGR